MHLTPLSDENAVGIAKISENSFGILPVSVLRQ